MGESRAFRVAIQPSDYGPGESSDRWRGLLEARGHEVVLVDVTRPDIFERLVDCHGFMWRWGHYASMRQIARRLLPVIERELGLVVFPDDRTSWHYDDKLAQAMLFEATGVAAPRSWWFFDKGAAWEWLQSACLPAVLKLSAGAGSSNVVLVQDVESGSRWLDELFGPGVRTMEPPLRRWRRWEDLARRTASEFRRGPSTPPEDWDVHKGYALFQEFCPGNDFDTRVTVIGDRAFGFRRYNRPGDFRASGSGRLDHDPGTVDPAFVALGFEVADRLGMQSCAIDGIWQGDRPVTVEVSYTYLSTAVHECPGHWHRRAGWQQGRMWPEEAQVDVFLDRLERHVGT